MALPRHKSIEIARAFIKGIRVVRSRGSDETVVEAYGLAVVKSKDLHEEGSEPSEILFETSILALLGI